jgi:hypothetical protein
MWFVDDEVDEIVRREGCYLVRPDDSRLAVIAEALNVHEQTGLTPAQLQARVAELEGARHKDDERTDFSLKVGDVVEKDNWSLTKLIVVDVNWALRAAALRLGEKGNVVVWSVAGLRRV